MLKNLRLVIFVPLAFGWCVLASFSLAETSAREVAGGEAEERLADCGASSRLAGTSLLRLPDELFGEVRFASCTGCSICEDDSDCGSGSCVPLHQSPVLCEVDEVCRYPTLVCSKSCVSCETEPCGPGETCTPIEQLPILCKPEPECTLPDVCSC